MSLIYFIKNNFTHIPYNVGKYISLVPFKYRPGISGIYKKRKIEISSFNQYEKNKYKNFIFLKTKNISSYAYKNIPFYQELYKSANVNPTKFSEFEDLLDLPIVNKSDLQNTPIDYRSNAKLKKILANTGGSSGQPLSFFIQPNSVPHEWAHMHTVWNKLGYKQSDLKIVFGGRADIRDIIEYDAVRHQLTVDIYKSPKQIADALYESFNKFKPKYIHGYPSAIFDFVIWLDISKHPLLELFKRYIEGMFLGSEFPSPLLRSKVEQLILCDSVSWYGHTERSVLAYEKHEKYTYSPFVTYGFSEAIKDTNTEQYNLISTSYYNLASPLIRYNTNDLINPTIKDGLLIDFQISSGRDGDYVLDRNRNKIYLTALIFGRHHAIFDYVQHIQIKQVDIGKVVLYITTNDDYTNKFLLDKMDLSNVALDFTIEIVSSPLKTAAGKVPLLIKS